MFVIQLKRWFCGNFTVFHTLPEPEILKTSVTTLGYTGSVVECLRDQIT